MQSDPNPSYQQANTASMRLEAMEAFNKIVILFDKTSIH